jgi:hypothetical protein
VNRGRYLPRNEEWISRLGIARSEKRPQGLKPASFTATRRGPGRAALSRSLKQPTSPQRDRNELPYRPTVKTRSPRPLPRGIRAAPRPGRRDFSPALSPGPRNSRTQHRGRAALQRRVQPLNATGLQPQWTVVRQRDHEPSVPPCLASFARRVLPRLHPSRNSAAPRPGRSRLQSCP